MGLTVAEALEAILSRAGSLGTEEVPLSAAGGRVLAEPIRCDTDLPPFDRAMMDGYAVRAADTTAAPVSLRVCGQVRAGVVGERPVGPGEAIQIMTGAPLPPGADAVQQVERTRRDGDDVVVGTAVVPGQNVAPRGCEAREGDVLMEAGGGISPATLAVLATAGVARVRVGRAPRVGVLVTGDELVGVGERPTGGRIRNSNGPAVLALARAAGAEPIDLGVAADDASEITAGVERGLALDVLVVSGGVSEGVFDLVEGVFARLGVTLVFTRVEVKPGAPLVFGVRGSTLVFGLPGNPVSAQVTFELFVRPALRRQQGATHVERPRVPVVLGGVFRNRSGRTFYMPARVEAGAEGLIAMPLRSAGSADVAAHARAGALVILPPDRTEARPGERAEALLLPSFLEA